MNDVCWRVEISRTYLSQIECGEATNLSWKVRQNLCATRLNLPPDDVQMLANLKYRGKQPDTSEKWEMLYDVIKMTVGK
ncbi:MAG: hypothetical protein NT070_04825 [Cyanobacteria bacterium]|nr:hypothetical protein [Cyanobacteriota bacterium]